MYWCSLPRYHYKYDFHSHHHHKARRVLAVGIYENEGACKYDKTPHKHILRIVESVVEDDDEQGGEQVVEDVYLLYCNELCLDLLAREKICSHSFLNI